MCPDVDSVKFFINLNRPALPANMVDRRAKRLQKFITEEEESHYRVAAALAAG